MIVDVEKGGVEAYVLHRVAFLKANACRANYRGISLLDVLSKFWKDKFIMRSLVLFAPILPTGSMVSYQENPLCLIFLKLFINSLTLLRGVNKLMLFIKLFLRLFILCLTKSSYLSLNALVLVDPC